MAKYQIQVGRCQGRYSTRYSMDDAAQAVRYYKGINIGRGYKKRFKENGKVIARTSPDMAYCPSPKRSRRESFLGRR